MSLDDPTPTEYFGPHAKRWTNPDTGVTVSLSPRDYYRALAKEQLQREKEVKARLQEKAEADGTPQPKPLASTDGIISMDTMYDRDLQPEAGLFKEKGALVEKEIMTGDIRYPVAFDADGRVVLTGPAEASTMPLPGPVAAVFGSPAVSHTLPAPVDKSHYKLVASTDPDDQAMLERGEIRYLTLSADDTIGRIQLIPDQAGEAPAARHLRRRRISRNAARLVLVYIIAVIGVAAVAGVIS